MFASRLPGAARMGMKQPVARLMSTTTQGQGTFAPQSGPAVSSTAAAVGCVIYQCGVNF